MQYFDAYIHLNLKSKYFLNGIYLCKEYNRFFGRECPINSLYISAIMKYNIIVGKII